MASSNVEHGDLCEGRAAPPNYIKALPLPPAKGKMPDLGLHIAQNIQAFETEGHCIAVRQVAFFLRRHWKW